MRRQKDRLEGDALPGMGIWAYPSPSLVTKVAIEACAVLLLASTTGAGAEENAADLAKDLTNPIANLISLPFQFNYDTNIGPADGERTFVNVQPVVPVSISEDWNLISRTIVPVIFQDDVVAGSDQFGIGDVVQSLFFSPKESTNGITWGVGPVFLLPTATDRVLGTDSFGLGPTAVALIQSGPWTVSFLTNHIWSVAGDDDRTDVNQTLLQPAVAYTTPDATTSVVNTETTYDWEADDASVPINAGVRKVFDFSVQKVALGAFGRYWITAPDSGPEGFGARVELTFLFPK